MIKEEGKSRANSRTTTKLVISGTRLGDFWKFLATNFIAKVDQLFGDFLGYFDKYHFLSQSCHGYSCTTFEEFGLLLIPTSSHTASDKNCISPTMDRSSDRYEGRSCPSKLTRSYIGHFYRIASSAKKSVLSDEFMGKRARANWRNGERVANKIMKSNLGSDFGQVGVSTTFHCTGVRTRGGGSNHKGDCNQYDQMAKLFVQYLADCNNENLPIFAKVGSKFFEH